MHQSKRYCLYELLSIKYQSQVTAKRQQMLSRIAIRNAVYSFMENEYLFSLLNQAANFFHLTEIEICVLGILLESFKFTSNTSFEGTIIFLAYIAKANFTGKILTYEQKLFKIFPNFHIEYANFLNLNFSNQEYKTSEIVKKYKELTTGVIVPKKEADDLEKNLELIMITGYKRKCLPVDERDELKIGEHFEKEKADFFAGEEFEDLI